MDAGVVSYPGLPPAVDSERLDELHIKVARYFGNKLGPAPLDGSRPSKILELGCGSGAWAIQAAMQFPDAEVVAVDQSPLPDRSFPPNITFQLADLAQRLNFEDQMFDIVHSRWVMSHLVDGADTIRRVSRLVKPGGVLLIEDTDLVSLAESGGPATRQLLYKYKEIQNTLGADTELGRKIEAIITSLGDFSDIQVKKLSIPFSANGPDEALNQFGLGMKKSTTEFFRTVPQRMHDQGITQELVHKFDEEQKRCDTESILHMYFCWARRSQ